MNKKPAVVEKEESNVYMHYSIISARFQAFP